MNNLRYFVEDNKLVVAFTSKKTTYEYSITLNRGDTKFDFQPVIYEEYEDYNFYQFSCSLADFTKFLQAKENSMSIQEEDENDNRDENEEVQDSEERSSYKFIITTKYLKYNESTDEVKDIEQIVKLNKKKWSLSDLSHVHNEGNDLIFVPYITKKGALALLINKELSETHYYRRKVISKIKVTEEQLKLEGNLTTRFFDIESGEIQLVERGGDQSINFPISIEQNKDQKENAFARRHHFKWKLSIEKIKNYLENLTKKEEPE